MKVSVVSAAYNEEKNVTALFEQIKAAMGERDYEVIIVDDGSTDDTYAELMKIRDDRLKIIALKEHRGKSFACYEGFTKARGEVIATLDADLENDPRDLPLMIEQLEGGYDLINGFRHDRKDGYARILMSRIANFVNNIVLGIDLHDNICPVKVFRKECVSKIRYFDNFHRFIPIMVKLQGYKIKEYKVRHRPRKHGVSKYGLYNRIFTSLKTLIIIKFKHKQLFKIEKNAKKQSR